MKNKKITVKVRKTVTVLYNDGRGSATSWKKQKLSILYNIPYTPRGRSGTKVRKSMVKSGYSQVKNAWRLDKQNMH